MSDAGRWIELGPGVLVRRYAELDLSIGLVVGDGGCLIVDTRGDEVQGAELADAVAAVTSAPWTIAITHAHFDHVFGTRALIDRRPAPVWAHARCVAALGPTGGDYRDGWIAEYREQGRPEMADALATARFVAPTALPGDRTELSVGGRQVVLAHLGRGHTDHDLLVQVPDAGVLFTGDLMENSGPPEYGDDAYPLEWPETLDAVRALLAGGTAVPGHGEPVDGAFVADQRDSLAAVAELCRAVRAGALGVDEAIRQSPYPERTTRDALAARFG